MPALLLVCKNMQVTTKRHVLNTGVHVGMCYDVTSIFEVG